MQNDMAGNLYSKWPPVTRLPPSPPLQTAPGQSLKSNEELALQGIEQAGIVSGQKQICCIHISGRDMHEKLEWGLYLMRCLYLSKLPCVRTVHCSQLSGALVKGHWRCSANTACRQKRFHSQFTRPCVDYLKLQYEVVKLNNRGRCCETPITLQIHPSFQMVLPTTIHLQTPRSSSLHEEQSAAHQPPLQRTHLPGGHAHHMAMRRDSRRDDWL